MGLFYHVFGLIFLEISKQFFKFVGCKMHFEMKIGRNSFAYLILTVLGFGVSFASSAQDDGRLSKASAMVASGDSLRMEYRFDESLALYEQALGLTQDIILQTAVDSAFRMDLEDKVLMSENGRNMMNFVDVPDVVAREKFSIGDFFLHYPLADSSWRSIPNQLDSADNHRIVRASFVRDDDKVVYWSSRDGEGIRNIYSSTLRDSIWTRPALLNEQMMSASDEIYPMLSPDGKSLFFASEGLHGVGGYDIYVSHWNEDDNDWDAPVNMGFPYSSPADDFLYMDTEDGRYSIFASNRGCSADSVWVYVLEFDNVPVRRAVDDPSELVKIAELEPVAEVEGSMGVRVSHEDADTQRYIQKMKEVRILKDSLSVYAAMVAEGKDVPRLSTIQENLSQAMLKLQQMEMEFLLKGVVLDPEKLMAEAERDMTGDESGYSFVKRTQGGPLNMVFEIPEVKFDYSFKVLDEAQFAEDQSIPSGIVYQIQMFASKRKASMKSLKGLSPVYEVPGANGHIVYRVGLFRTYSDVLANLNTVKKLGFRGAFIVAFVDGKSVTVAKARAKEKEKPKVQELYEVRMVPSGGELDAGVADGVRQQASGKDIARVVRGDGTVVYVVGPFTDRSKAEELALFVKAMGVNEATCNVIGK